MITPDPHKRNAGDGDSSNHHRHRRQDQAADRLPHPTAGLQPGSPGPASLAARLPSFSRPPLIAGVGAITAICGILDAATFLGLGPVFAETMNGNIVFLAFTVGAHGIPSLTSVLPSNVLP